MEKKSSNLKTVADLFRLGGVFIFIATCAFGMFFKLMSANAILNPISADEQKFAAVGAIQVGEKDSVHCTATLIASNWIITADHCIHATGPSEVEGDGPVLPPQDYEFRLGQNFKNAFFKSRLKRWVGGPTVRGETIDVAFGELSKAVPADLLHAEVRLDPILPQVLAWNKKDLEASYVHVGYGTIVPFSEEKFALSDQRQKALFSVTSFSGNALLNLFGDSTKLENYLNLFHQGILEYQSLDAIIATAKLNSGYSIHAWDARGRKDLKKIESPEGGWQDTCFGDSGGPLLREINGTWRVVGVVSHGMDRICTPLGTNFTVFGPEVQKLMQKLKIRY